MSNQMELQQDRSRHYQALILGRAGMDLYPMPDGRKTRDAESFSTDVGGSAGNIAVAMAKAGARVGLLSGLSEDAVGDFVRNRLQEYGVDTSLITTTSGNERTSLALAEVRADDCEVVIYRNNPADLGFTLSDESRQAISQASHLVITGTSLIDEQSRANTLELLDLAAEQNCPAWFDLDYRAWNWPDLETTRRVYLEAAELCQVLVGNEEEFAVLAEDLDQLITRCRESGQFVLLKKGSAGSTLYAGETRLDSGIFPVQPLKPYGSGDAFLGNLIASYTKDADWQLAIQIGSAAAALVVSRRGCASAMPTPDQIQTLYSEREMIPAPSWS
ncbi:MAG: PfkB family carbohydrate kinase [Gammaproteobacteria bacterium]|nr:PfkB family carbohydrate kinase [Gammaproteobacteria bacterium]